MEFVRAYERDGRVSKCRKCGVQERAGSQFPFYWSRNGLYCKTCAYPPYKPSSIKINCPDQGT